jgi:LysM repeat protein
MKIMKVLGVVVGIHLFALILIFANPGCSSTSKPTPAPIDTMAKSESAPTVSVPGVSSAVNVPLTDSSASAMTPAPILFNPDAPATAAGGGLRFSPTRPGTAAASTLVAEPVADVTPATPYAVKSGDSLWTIAKKNNLSVSDLATANNLKAGATLRPGQKLLIPSKPAAATAPAATAAAGRAAKAADAAVPKPSADSVKHVVKSGETLSMIAKKYGVKLSDIAVANNISDPQKIFAGMELIIPGWQAAGGKSAKPAAKPAATGTTAKPASAVPEIKPLFDTPGSGSTPDAGARPASGGEVPVIRVDDTPAEPKPKS